MNLPPYLFTKHDEANKKIAVSVGDPTIKHQAAMWGESHNSNSKDLALACASCIQYLSKQI